ncbi:GGDEF domain-containing protein [Proteiniclasticum sp. SCR006]|uniref:GGDEF domain-containing protein n=1 Tax=Proteiniclasticum aestuarii TaxID=2817862 RepID=A0A939HDN8_9CLOT|nr:GGDEF domain-containing protein [Proteiniclasticum aestuarii]MBO1266036.1 GGDEF domain-containing protein [Proteiniclasticum aestuarii]
MEQKIKSSWTEPLFTVIFSKKHITFLSILLLVTMIFSGIGLIIHRSVQGLLLEELRYTATNTAVTAAAFIEEDISPYVALTQVENYEEGDYDVYYYERMQRIFREIRRGTNVDFIYTMKQLSENTVLYLLDGEDPASDLFSPIGSTEKMDSYQKDVLTDNKIISTDMILWEGWGKYITGHAPIRDQMGRVIGFVGVDIGTMTVRNLMRKVDQVISVVALFIILLVTFYSYKIIEDRSNAYNEDYLTKLYTRRHHDRQLEMHIRKVRKKGGELSVMMIDVDDFKKINDQYGHEAGDRMLRYVAGVIRKNLRKTDISSRIGGDEFNIILPGTSLEDAGEVATRILSELEGGKESVKVSVSIGVAKWEKTMDASILTNIADQAMYKAKESGRNQVQMIQGHC